MNSIATKTVTAKNVEKNYKKLMLRHSKENKVEISVATENGRDMRPTKTSMLQQKLQYCNKNFNIATNNSASDQDQRRLCRDKEKVCRDNRPRQL